MKMSKSSVDLIKILEVEKQGSVGWGKKEIPFTWKKKKKISECNCN